MLESLEYVRPVNVAQRRVSDRDLVEVKLLGYSKLDAFASNIAVVVVADRLGSLAVVDVNAAELNLDNPGRFGIKIELSQIQVFLPAAGSPTGRIPKSSERWAGCEIGVDTVFALFIELETEFADELILVVVRRFYPIGVLDKVIPCTDRKLLDLKPARDLVLGRGRFGWVFLRLSRRWCA